MSTGEAGAAELIAQGEDALARGEPSRAYELLGRAAATPVDGPLLYRLASAYAGAARYLSRPDEVLAWIDGQIAACGDGAARTALLVARLGVYRLLDSARVLELCDEAFAAAAAAGDDEAFARALSHAAFAAYRRGDARRARELAERAGALAAPTRAAQYHAIRAKIFAASAAGDLETNLELCMKARALARELGSVGDQANESNNLAEIYLELGCPAEARACAEAGVELAGAASHAAVRAMGLVYRAVALAEAGDLDGALAAFAELHVGEAHRFVRVDACGLHAFWLLERGAAGDVRRARETAEQGLAAARATAADHRLTAMHACLARAWAREGQDAAARAELERARKAADRGDPSAQSMLALAAAEVLTAQDAARAVALSTARTRILRRATRREDPHAFCARVRLNRRILELSGGVPPDLPGAA